MDIPIFYKLSALCFALTLVTVMASGQDTSFYELDEVCYQRGENPVNFYSEDLPAPCFINETGLKSDSFRIVQPRTSYNSELSFFLLMALCLVGVLSLNVRQRKWSDVFSVIWKNSDNLTYFKEQREQYTAFQLFGTLFFGLISGLFLWQNLQLLPVDTPELVSFLLYSTIAIALFYSKYLFLKMMGILLDLENIFNYAAYNLNLFAYTASFLAGPFLFVHVFSQGIPREIAGTAFIAVYGFIYLAALYRSFVFSISNTGGYFLHFILYLCALEILPLILWINFFIEAQVN